MASLDLGTLQVGVKVDGVDKATTNLKMLSGNLEETSNDAVKSNSEMQSAIMKLAHEYKSSGMNMSEAMKKANTEIRAAQAKTTEEGTKGLSFFQKMTKCFKDGAGEAKVFGGSLGDVTGALSGGAGASALLGGAIAGLGLAFVQLATQAIQQAITALIEFGKQSIQVSSDLEESANVVQVVFGEENKVSKWAHESASAFNLSRLEAEKFAGTMGAVLTPTNLGTDVVEEMSVTLTKLSGDLGSLWNKSSEDAFNALRSAITGETEPMKAFGVVMTQTNLEAFALSEGINKTWKEMNEAEKATLRYNYILANTKTAQGDAANTADGYANSSKQLTLAMENASEAMGSKMLPGLASIKQTITDFIKDNQSMFALLGNIFGFFVDVIANTLKSINFITTPIRSLIDLISKGLNLIITPLRECINLVNDFFYSWGIGENTAEDIKYEMLDMADVTKDSMSNAAKDVENSFSNMSDSAKNELDAVKSALDSYYDKERSERQKKLEERYGDSKGAAIRIAKEMAKYDEQMSRKKESDYKQQETIYTTDVRNFSKAEENKTKKYEEEAKKRQSIANKYSSSESSTSFSGVTNKYANGTLSAPGGWSVVGETGRELMYVPPKAQIVNNNTTEQILGSGNGPTYHINTVTVQSNTPKEFFRELEEISRRK